MNLSEVLEQILTVLFPKQCFACHTKKDRYLCASCAKVLPRLTTLTCPLCQSKETAHGCVCSSCQQDAPIDGIASLFPFQNGVIKNLIHSLKYNSIPDIAHEMGEFLWEIYADTHIPLPDIIVAAPLHAKRIRSRGFNQSEEIAKALYQKLLEHTLEKPISFEPNTLLRQRYTTPQADIKDRHTRLLNPSGAFMLNPKYAEAIQNKYIWIVDDVYTTGATLFECSQILKSSGARKVWGITLAH